MKNSISFILCSKNDDYEGGALSRLQTSLNHNLEITKTIDREFIITDWGSDTPLESVITIPEEHKHCVRWLYVPKSVTEKYDSPFVEVLSLNAAARRSTKNFIARLDQDILVGNSFMHLVTLNRFTENEFYFSNRRDFAKDQPVVCSQEKVFISPYGSPYYHYAVGMLLIPKDLWFKVKGYNESMIYYCHMEHDFIARCDKHASLINLGAETNFDFYHLYHERQQGKAKKLNTLNMPFINDDNWGLINEL